LESQDNKYWSAENLMLVHKMSLNNVVVYVWCAVSAAAMNGPIFFLRPLTHTSMEHIFLQHFFITCPIMTVPLPFYCKTVQYLTLKSVLYVVCQVFLVTE